MRSMTVILDALDTPKSLATLAALGTAIYGAIDANALHAKIRNVKWFRIYAESSNNIDVTNGPARIGFEQLLVAANFKTSRVVATQHGQPLLPGLPVDFLPDGQGAPYDFSIIALTGAIGDQFQIAYDPA